MPKSSSEMQSNVLKPVNQSVGLPNSHYIDEEIFKKNEANFRKIKKAQDDRGKLYESLGRKPG